MSDEVVVLDASAHRAYLMCHKRLWLEAHRPELVTPTDYSARSFAGRDDVIERIRREIIKREDCPDVSVGKKCKSSQFVCPLYDHCWSGIDGMTIYDIPNLRSKRLLGLESHDILMLEDVPLDALTAKQGAFVRWILGEEININVHAIETAMADIQYPIYFLDFETIDHAVPVWDGVKPHQAVPFQYSVHVLYEDGRLEHSSYLHMDSSDPRHSLATKLADDIGETGTVVAYNIGFERGVLLGLAEHVPAIGYELRSIAARLWDQLPIFQKHYRDHRFGRSNGLKSVLPVVCPHLSYDDLAVKDGLAAQIAFEKMIASDNADEKADIAFALLAYCDLDTLAMVEIHKVLIAL